MTLFETGPIIMTPGIRELISEGPYELDIVQRCLERHTEGDWGQLCDDDKQLNRDSLREEKEKGYTSDNLVSSYDTELGRIYIITECDRSVTTILTPSEYR